MPLSINQPALLPPWRRLRLLFVWAALAASLSQQATAQAGHQHHDSTAPPPPADTSGVAGMNGTRGMGGMRPMPGMPSMPERPFGIPMTRMGSGTAWLPDASAMRAWHFGAGPWMLMVHGDAFVQYDHQGGVRGDDQLGSINWGMLMAMRPLGRGTLHLHGMVSAEPFTVGKRGYPLLLQTGEVADGEPLHDRQHPHDLFMELSAMYELPIAGRLGAMLYVAPVGEPGIGPVAYMHRPSALNDPFAPLAHHWMDATHITYGVVTAGLFTRSAKLEATLFNGREPDEDRYDFDFHPLHSWGLRLSLNPTPHWALSASYGYLDRPEELHPDENQHRVGISMLRSTPRGTRGEWATALIYGANQHIPAGAAGSRRWSHSVIAESNLQFDRRNSVFARMEYVQKSAEDLVVDDMLGERFDIGSLAVGYVRELTTFRGATFGAGARGAINLVPRALEQVYGSRTPVGLAVFVRVRPSLLASGHDGMDMTHDQPMPE